MVVWRGIGEIAIAYAIAIAIVRTAATSASTAPLLEKRSRWEASPSSPSSHLDYSFALLVEDWICLRQDLTTNIDDEDNGVLEVLFKKRTIIKNYTDPILPSTSSVLAE